MQEYIRNSMKQKRKVFNLLHPLESTLQNRETVSNIFQSTLYQDGQQLEDTDRFVAGAKEVRIYKNKVKRKQKLTSANPSEAVKKAKEA